MVLLTLGTVLDGHKAIEESCTTTELKDSSTTELKEINGPRCKGVVVVL
jgi:hypothetical protein